MKSKEVYNLYCLSMGFAAVITITYFLIRSPYDCIIMFEPIWWIRSPEILIGFSVAPYYFSKLFLDNK